MFNKLYNWLYFKYLSRRSLDELQEMCWAMDYTDRGTKEELIVRLMPNADNRNTDCWEPVK